jgi:methionyl-tRNA formyltransferase
MAKTNVIIFGYDELLTASLEFFSRTRNRISAVVFPSNRTDWRAAKIRQIVREKGLLTLEQPPRNKISELAKTLRRLKPDLVYAWSYPMILPEEIIDIPKYGCVNVHMGLLPEYRGVNGVRWALLKGEEKTGITIHFMDSGIDTGKIIARVSFPITAQDDILSLMKKSKSAGLYLLENCWHQIASGKVHAIPQDESKSNYYSAKISSFETIDWSKSNVEIHNLIRASVAPFPGVYTFWKDHKLILRKSVPVKNLNQSAAAGVIEKIDSNGVEITTGNGNLLVTRIEIDGKTISTAKLSDFGLRGGSQFENSKPKSFSCGF